MFFVPGVDAFRAVAREKIPVEFQPRLPFQDRYAIFFGAAGIHSGFIDHYVPLFKGFTHGVAGVDQWVKVRALVLVDGGGDGDDVDVAGFQRRGVGGDVHEFGLSQFVGAHFQRTILAGLEFGDASLIDVETNAGELLAELHGKR